MRSLSPTIELMKADARPGCCVVCDAALPPHFSVTCGDGECLRTWVEVYRADQGEQRRAKTAARRGLLSVSHRLLGSWLRRQVAARRLA